MTWHREAETDGPHQRREPSSGVFLLSSQQMRLVYNQHVAINYLRGRAKEALFSPVSQQTNPHPPSPRKAGAATGLIWRECADLASLKCLKLHSVLQLAPYPTAAAQLREGLHPSNREEAHRQGGNLFCTWWPVASCESQKRLLWASSAAPRRRVSLLGLRREFPSAK